MCVSLGTGGKSASRVTFRKDLGPQTLENVVFGAFQGGPHSGEAGRTQARQMGPDAMRGSGGALSGMEST